MTQIFIGLFICGALVQEASAQPTLPSDLTKPKKFENKKLGSEKTAEKKFSLPRRFTQNTVTHYNWYFNANTKLNEIVAMAKAFHIDDYSQLISFYNYDLDYTAANSSELDSVIYRANAGILVHDLRNSWIDNLYMLMGRAYFYKKELDSAYLTFQFINYSYAPKEKDGYDKPIGSNSTEGGNAFVISTKEKNSISKKVFTTPPSRNESLVWQVRTYIAKDELGEAAALIETLKADPVFPERLQPDLYEVQAWWFYKKRLYDSAAVYLEKALNNAENKQEEARWEYLIAQLYERSSHPEKAEEFYDRAIKHTLNPMLEVYARLNSIRQNKSDSNAIQNSIDELLKMGRKDRYANYRDLIYLTAARAELERGNIKAARALVLKATEVTTTNTTTSQRTKAFLLLGDLSYQERNYRDAKRFYDSVVTNDPSIEDPAALENRKNLLSEIVFQSDVINRQDSLQRLASLPEAEREAFIKKQVKKIRKEQGLKEEDPTTVSQVAKIDNRPVSDLFETDTKGEWYFYNPSLKSKGYSDFRKNWGNRPNIDNWRRMNAVNKTNVAIVNDPGLVSSRGAGPDSTALSYEAMLKNVPLTAPQLNASNDSIQVATMLMTTAYMEGLEDYPGVIQTLEPFLQRFPATIKRPQALFQLYYSYLKTGDQARADNMLRLLQEQYPGTEYAKIATQSSKGISSDPQKVAITARYDSIYTLFIEGRFEEALALKKAADSLYGKNYWTPQLLYIESIYHIRQRQDSTAKTVLQNITSLYPSTPMAAKAQTLIDVLNRRNEIESYLTNLQITRPPEDSTALATVSDSTAIAAVKDSTALVTIKDSSKVAPLIDTTTQKAAAITQPQQQAVTKNQPQQPVVTNVPPPIIKPVEIKKDSVKAKPLPPPNRTFSFNAGLPHLVVVVMDKVDPVYVSESRNAFNRYNKEKYYNKVIDINNQVLNDTTRLVVMSNFENAAAALDYLEKTRKAAAKEIVPWLPAGKYSFILISTDNLEVLKTSNNLGEYKKFLQQSFPGKFD